MTVSNDAVLHGFRYQVKVSCWIALKLFFEQDVRVESFVVEPISEEDLEYIVDNCDRDALPENAFSEGRVSADAEKWYIQIKRRSQSFTRSRLEEILTCDDDVVSRLAREYPKSLLESNPNAKYLLVTDAQLNSQTDGLRTDQILPETHSENSEVDWNDEGLSDVDSRIFVFDRRIEGFVDHEVERLLVEKCSVPQTLAAACADDLKGRIHDRLWRENVGGEITKTECEEILSEHEGGERSTRPFIPPQEYSEIQDCFKTHGKVIIEGPEAVGKQRVRERLVEKLRSSGEGFEVHQMPSSDVDIRERLRQDTPAVFVLTAPFGRVVGDSGWLDLSKLQEFFHYAKDCHRFVITTPRGSLPGTDSHTDWLDRYIFSMEPEESYTEADLRKIFEAYVGQNDASEDIERKIVDQLNLPGDVAKAGMRYGQEPDDVGQIIEQVSRISELVERDMEEFDDVQKGGVAVWFYSGVQEDLTYYDICKIGNRMNFSGDQFRRWFRFELPVGTPGEEGFNVTERIFESFHQALLNLPNTPQLLQDFFKQMEEVWLNSKQMQFATKLVAGMNVQSQMVFAGHFEPRLRDKLLETDGYDFRGWLSAADEFYSSLADVAIEDGDFGAYCKWLGDRLPQPDNQWFTTGFDRWGPPGFSEQRVSSLLSDDGVERIGKKFAENCLSYVSMYYEPGAMESLCKLAPEMTEIAPEKFREVSEKMLQGHCRGELRMWTEVLINGGEWSAARILGELVEVRERAAPSLKRLKVQAATKEDRLGADHYAQTARLLEQELRDALEMAVEYGVEEVGEKIILEQDSENGYLSERYLLTAEVWPGNEIGADLLQRVLPKQWGAIEEFVSSELWREISDKQELISLLQGTRRLSVVFAVLEARSSRDKQERAENLLADDLERQVVRQLRNPTEDVLESSDGEELLRAIANEGTPKLAVRAMQYFDRHGGCEPEWFERLVDTEEECEALIQRVEVPVDYLKQFLAESSDYSVRTAALEELAEREPEYVKDRLLALSESDWPAVREVLVDLIPEKGWRALGVLLKLTRDNYIVPTGRPDGSVQHPIAEKAKELLEERAAEQMSVAFPPSGCREFRNIK
jgi:hypothetical protein